MICRSVKNSAAVPTDGDGRKQPTWPATCRMREISADVRPSARPYRKDEIAIIGSIDDVGMKRPGRRREHRPGGRQNPQTPGSLHAGSSIAMPS